MHYGNIGGDVGGRGRERETHEIYPSEFLKLFLFQLALTDTRVIIRCERYI